MKRVPNATDSRQPGASELDVEGLTKRYGGLTAVDGFCASLKSGEIVGLIGPNGAGKTTVFNLITGLDEPDAGTVRFRGRDITGIQAHRIARLGVARTFQNTRLLRHLSVLDNVKIAYHKHVDYHLLHAVLRLPRYASTEREITSRCMEFLRLFDLDSCADDPAGSLPYGKRRGLEIARALATEGSLLLLDEPAAGLNPLETRELSCLIRRIRDQFKVTILLIEHDMKLVMGVCERVVVLDYGKVIARGSPEQIKTDPLVIEAYLGRSRAY
jgi:branched-chain amino acid transport system ATP-binding protein